MNNVAAVEVVLKNHDINQLNESGETALWNAVNSGKIKTVKYLLTQNADPNLTGPNTHTPLVIAVSRNNIEMCITLLEHPTTNVNATSVQNCTAIFAAAQLGFEDIMKLLLEKGADPSFCIDFNNTSPLHVAIGNGHYGIVEQLIQAAPYLVRKVETFLKPNQSSPLFLAAMKGRSYAVDLLLKARAPINLPNKEGITPIYVAAQNGHTDIVQKLLKAGANYTEFGLLDGNGQLAHPLRTAAERAHLDAVKLLLKYPHADYILETALNYTVTKFLECRDAEKRQVYIAISDCLQQGIKAPALPILTFRDSKPLTWEQSFQELFDQEPRDNDRIPDNKKSALRYVLVAIYQLMQDPYACIPYIQHFSKELERQWAAETDGQQFPCFDTSKITFWSQDGHLWPIPEEDTLHFKRCSLLERILLAKFREYDMGETPSKWTGFIPELYAREYLLKNTHFVENRRTLNGLFHGNMHNLQRVISILAMESGAISLDYRENGSLCTLQPKEVFSALMRQDIHPSGSDHIPLWGKILDSAYYDKLSLSHPHRFYSLLLTSPEFSGSLQNYMCFSFCHQFIKMRDLHNHVYGSDYNSLTLCREIGKFKLNLFETLQEFAIQMEEKNNLQEVVKIDDLEEGAGRSWYIRPKQYLPLKISTGRFGLFNTMEKEALAYTTKNLEEMKFNSP